MNPKEISCNCDVQGSYNCPKHNPNHPSNVIPALRSQLTTLQQENIMLAAQVERMKLALKRFEGWIECTPHVCIPCEADEPHPPHDAAVIAKAALSQTPPPTYASKVMELARCAMKRYQFKPGFDVFRLEAPLDDAAAAFTPEELTWLGGM